VRLLILAALLGAVGWLILRSFAPPGRSGGEGGGRSGGRTAEPLVQDPVCKTFIPRRTAILVHKGGEEHYFCSERCAEVFRKEH
jgi:YHS domain-containing protein